MIVWSSFFWSLILTLGASKLAELVNPRLFAPINSCWALKCLMIRREETLITECLRGQTQALVCLCVCLCGFIDVAWKSGYKYIVFNRRWNHYIDFLCCTVFSRTTSNGWRIRTVACSVPACFFICFAATAVMSYTIRRWTNILVFVWTRATRGTDCKLGLVPHWNERMNLNIFLNRRHTVF